MTKTYGLIGLPVGHSLSPQIWTRVFAAAARPTWRYAAHDVAAGELSAWFGRVRAGEIAGAHVTMPADRHSHDR
jgi:shikimate 5-dehydrogenase